MIQLNGNAGLVFSTASVVTCIMALDTEGVKAPFPLAFFPVFPSSALATGFRPLRHVVLNVAPEDVDVLAQLHGSPLADAPPVNFKYSLFSLLRFLLVVVTVTAACGAVKA